MARSMSPTSHDDLYYLESIVFLVEGTLFKVPRHGFQKNSGIFASTFSLPSGPDVQEGQSDAKPFELRGVVKADFKSLLKVMYPFGPGLPTDLTREEWVGVLKLSTMWEFQDIRKTAIQKISGMQLPIVDKILIGKEHRVSQWVLSGYEQLVEQTEPLTVEKHHRLGWETMTRLLLVREMFRERKLPGVDLAWESEQDGLHISTSNLGAFGPQHSVFASVSGPFTPSVPRRNRPLRIINGHGQLHNSGGTRRRTPLMDAIRAQFEAELRDLDDD